MHFLIFQQHGEKGKGSAVASPRRYSKKAGEEKSVCLCVSMLSFCPLAFNSVEIWMWNKDASASSVTIFYRTKAIPWFTKLRTKAHRLCVAFMWSDLVRTSQAQQSVWQLNLAAGAQPFNKLFHIFIFKMMANSFVLSNPRKHFKQTKQIRR